MTDFSKEFLESEYHHKGKTWRQIAIEHNVSDTLLIKLARSFNIVSRSLSDIGKNINNLPVDDIVTAYTKGKSIKHIADQYEVVYSVIHNLLKTAGVVLRKSGIAISCSRDNKVIKRWQWDNKRWLEAAYVSASILQIAEHIGWSKTIVLKQLSEFNIQRRRNLGPKTNNIERLAFPSFLNITDLDELNHLIQIGCSDAEIVDKLGFSQAAIASAKIELSIGAIETPVYRTGPAFASLSMASKHKWTDPSVRTKIIIGNQKKWLNADYRQKMAIRRSEHPTISSIQKQLYFILDELGVTYNKEGPETVRGHFVFDASIPNYYNGKTLLLEVQGNYWHNLERVKQNDRRKFTIIDRYFTDHQIMYIWEHEFDKLDLLKDRLRIKLGLTNPIPIDYSFDELRIIKADFQYIKSFLDCYHYLGSARGGLSYAAVFNNEIVAAVLFASPLRQNLAGRYASDNLLELARLCVNPLYRKKNLASWFLSRVIKQLKCEKIIAFSDISAGHLGSVYKAANFREDHHIAPDYWYLSSDHAVFHKKTIYNKAKAIGLTEKDFVVQHGLLKVFGSEKIAFVYDLYNRQ